MPQLTPSYPVGYIDYTGAVVLCPKCGNKRWANIQIKWASNGKKNVFSAKDRKVKGYRTVCCGQTVVL